MSEIVEVTTDNVDEMISKYTYLLLDFTATWCGPCKTLDPMLKEIVSNIDNENFALGKVNVDNNQDIALRFDVMNVPTMVFLKDNNPIDIIVSVPKKKELQSKIESFIAE